MPPASCRCGGRWRHVALWRNLPSTRSLAGKRECLPPAARRSVLQADTDVRIGRPAALRCTTTDGQHYQSGSCGPCGSELAAGSSHAVRRLCSGGVCRRTCTCNRRKHGLRQPALCKRSLLACWCHGGRLCGQPQLMQPDRPVDDPLVDCGVARPVSRPSRREQLPALDVCRRFGRRDLAPVATKHACLLACAEGVSCLGRCKSLHCRRNAVGFSWSAGAWRLPTPAGGLRSKTRGLLCDQQPALDVC